MRNCKTYEVFYREFGNKSAPICSAVLDGCLDKKQAIQSFNFWDNKDNQYTVVCVKLYKG